MKIIFDTPHQKETFFRVVRKKFGCPSIFGLPEYSELDCGAASCKACWLQAIEVEVAEKQEGQPWWKGTLDRFMRRE